MSYRSLVNSLQQQLETLYEIEAGHEVNRFLTTDTRLLDQQDRTAPEYLFLSEHSEGLDLSLYLDAEILESLLNNNPLQNLHHHNLDAYLVALEGISHFTYLLWHAQRGRQISLFELELQAEVDKFIAATHLLWQQENTADPRQLHDFLFTRSRFAEDLTAAERSRYSDANYYAGKYCYNLTQRYQHQYADQRVWNDLRRFYRSSQQAKLARITGA